MKYQLSTDEEDVLYLKGEISFSNIKEVQIKGAALMDTLATIRVDLSGLTYSDSSGLALLTAWIRTAKIQHKDIIFCNMPQFLADLGRVSGLDAILPIAEDIG